MRRFASARRRFTSELKARGIVSTVKMLVRYAVWRLRGSPAPTYPDPPSLQVWLDAFGTLDPSAVGSTTYSVICPVHDTPPEMLRACVGSVLDQGYPNWELILVDDASTDVRTAQTLREVSSTDARIKLVRLTENVGIAEATNVGARTAAGEYLVFLDHDDLLAPTALAWLSTCTGRQTFDEDKKMDITVRFSNRVVALTFGHKLHKPSHVRTVGPVQVVGGLDRHAMGSDHDSCPSLRSAA